MTNDKVGKLTLENLEKAGEFNKWMVEQITPFLKEPILEVGSGIGNITKLLLEKKLQVLATDIEPEYLQILKDRYGQSPYLAAIEYLDLESDELMVHDKFNTILLINVLEHVKDPIRTLQRLTEKLHPNGQIIVLVPAYSKLYCNLDKNLGHYKRYSRDLLKSEVESAGMKNETMWHFNFIGILGWYLWGKICRGHYLNSPLIRTYESFMPINKIIDKLVMNRAGLSLISVAKKV